MTVPGFRARARKAGWVRLLLIAVVLAPTSVPTALALEPSQVLVVANRNARGSMDLAAYYMERRGIPQENLLRLWATDAETCTRKEYDDQIAMPVRKRLARDSALRAAVLMYGVPLRVRPPEPSREEQETLTRLQGERQELAGRVEAPAEVEPDVERLRERLKAVQGLIQDIRREDWEASVDSELTLVRSDRYPLNGWIPNPAREGVNGLKGAVPADAVLAVSRLDGPDEAVVRRIIDDSIATETAGLQGGAYLDARWKDPGPGRDLTGYALYDRSIHEVAAVLRGKGIPVVVDDQNALFPAGAALPAALYCGWYSLGRYVGAFAWRRGAVGYHIASSECATLKREGSQVWCKRMLEEGVAATLGPVSEPYVQAFPLPSLFFALLTDGRFTLAETYLRSVPYLSWKMVLIGDPLYRPFRNP